jgi:hypothetical protein
MRFFYVLIILAIAFHYNFGAVLIATTEDGRKVILKEDNSWKFATPNDIEVVKSLQAKDSEKAQNDKQKEEDNGARVQMKSKGSDEPERAGFLDVIQGDNSFDIRKALWGMEKAAVKKSENLQLIKETPATLEYQFKLIGLESKIVYKFSRDKAGKDRLVGAQYIIDQDDVNPARFFDDYKALKSYLRKLYGAPVSDENEWSNDIYKADQNNWGFAISLGFLTCKATWKSSRTKAVLLLSGSNHILSTNIQYSGPQ